MEAAIGNVRNGIHSIQDHHHYIRIRNARAHQTNESTLKRLWWMCVLEMFVIVACGLAQVAYIQGMFRKR